MNLNQSCYAIVSYKIKCDFWNLIPMSYHSIFFNETIITATSNFRGMSAKNDYLLQIEEIVRIYANSKYLDRNGYFLFWLSIYWIKNMTFLHNDGLKQTELKADNDWANDNDSSLSSKLPKKIKLSSWKKKKTENCKMKALLQ